MKTSKYTLLTKQLPDGQVVLANGEEACGRGSCPAVLKTADGKAIVVGRVLTRKQQKEITQSGLIAFHDGEIGVEVEPDLLRKLDGLL
ncbi:MAG TPA: hypothetical protein VFA90_17330 [Terriglobales bacterium]|nr:hypothetical protein [Terriglobales bacterium]